METHGFYQAQTTLSQHRYGIFSIENFNRAFGFVGLPVSGVRLPAQESMEGLIQANFIKCSFQQPSPLTRAVVNKNVLPRAANHLVEHDSRILHMMEAAKHTDRIKTSV